MKLIFCIALVACLSLCAWGQSHAEVIPSSMMSRDEALARYNELKSVAAALQRVVLAPLDEDIGAANRLGVNAARIVPREKYDNSYSAVAGGGSYYGFYYRTHDWGWGTELGLSQGHLSTGFSDFSVMADLGEKPLIEVSKDSREVKPLANYSKAIFAEYYEDSTAARQRGELKIGDMVYVSHVKPLVGHSYVLRSKHSDYYDILVSFEILRQDPDGSLVFLWKLLEQYDSPSGRNPRNKIETDSVILDRAKTWLKDPRFSKVRLRVESGVSTLEGTVSRTDIAHLTQLATSGARKVINQLTVY